MLGSRVGEIVEGFATLELGVLDNACAVLA
jgi:hypothetical protein